MAKIRAGEIIKPHRDLHPNWFNKVRIHIPVITNPNVLFHVWETDNVLKRENRTDFHMTAGSSWVFDTWRAHAVTNFSQEDRIHLIIDIEPRDRLFSLMFDGVPERAVRECLAYEYPREYQTDMDTLRWLTGGNIDVGIHLWQTTIVGSNPQLNRYQYDPEFWR